MPDTFLVLCRFYLRVDHVMVRILDTRLYGEGENDEFMIREWTKREANYSQLNKEVKINLILNKYIFIFLRHLIMFWIQLNYLFVYL